MSQLLVSARTRLRATVAWFTSVFHLQDVKLSREGIVELSWLAGGQLATLLLSIISIKLTTSIGPNEYGKVTLAASVGGAFMLAFFGPLEQGYVRYYFDYAGQSRMRSLFCSTLLRVLAFCLTVLLLLSGAAVLGLHKLYQLDPLFTAAAALMIAFALLAVPLNGMLNAMRLRRETAIIQVVERVLIIVLLFVLLARFASDATTVMLAIGVATSLAGIARLLQYSRTIRTDAGEVITGNAVETGATRLQIYRSIARYSTPFVLWGLMGWLQSNSERWVINGMLTQAEVGRYGLTVNIINSSAVVLFTIMSQFITPIIFNRFPVNQGGDISRGMDLIRLYGWATLLLFMGIAVGLFFVGETVIHLLSSKAFVVDSILLFLLTMGLGVFYVGQTFTTVGLALKQPNVYMSAKIVTGLLSVVLYLVGCYWAGVLGVVCAIGIANVLYLVLVLRTNRALLRSFRTQSS
jgi:O-antigen/teichoic acid export membrane protein